jgi:hypothetical protein
MRALLFRIAEKSPGVCLRLLADERGSTAGNSGPNTKGRGAMDGRTTLGNALAGFAVGLFVHAIPASWWPRWLRELVGKDE